MRQLIQSYRSGAMSVDEVPPPTVRAGGVLVRTVRSVVSAGTEKRVVDLARKSLLAKAWARPDLVRKVIDTARKQGVANAVRKTRSKLDTPIPLGYSAAGVVVAVGERWRRLVPELAETLSTDADLVVIVDDVDSAVSVVRKALRI